MRRGDDQDVHLGFAGRGGARASAPMATFLEHVEAIPEFVAYKAALRDGLRLRRGEVVLDIGCGLGTHAVRIAAGHEGPVIGMDRADMTAQARGRAPAGTRVRWLVGDAVELPLSDGSVDACVVGRVLKYLPRPEAAVAEMVRVLRPGGRVAAFELDYDSLTLAGDPDVADAVQAVLCRSVAQPRMGRRLPDLFARHGLTDVTNRAVAFVAPWPVHEMIVRTPVRLAIADGRLDRDPTRAWLADQERPGALTSIHVGVLATARRPPADVSRSRSD